MERDYIEIKKELIPYSFNIELLGSMVNLSVSYNKKHDFFTLRLVRDGVVMCEGEPMVYGTPLFNELPVGRKNPMPPIIPFDESGIENTVTFENLNNTVYLVIDNARERI